MNIYNGFVLVSLACLLCLYRTVDKLRFGSSKNMVIDLICVHACPCMHVCVCVHACVVCVKDRGSVDFKSFMY